MTDSASMRALLLAAVLGFSGCAAHKPRAVVPQLNICYDINWVQSRVAGPCPLVPVPGHPSLHLGEPFFDYDGSLTRNWLTKENQPVLTPLGCWLAKTRLTWVFGDRVSMCEHYKGEKQW